MEFSKTSWVSVQSRLQVCYSAAYWKSSSQSVNLILNRTLSDIVALLYANVEMPLLQPERPSMMLRSGCILGEPHGGRRTVGYQGGGGVAPVGVHQHVTSQMFQQRLAGVFELSSDIELTTAGVNRTRKDKVANRTGKQVARDNTQRATYGTKESEEKQKDVRN